MATLAPVLGGNAASFERPVQQGASGIEGLASVLGTVGNALSTAIANNQPAAPRELTQDERFSAAWREYSATIGSPLMEESTAYRDNLRIYAPQFLRAYPEFAGQMGEYLSQFGIDNTLTPTQRTEILQEDAMVTFFGSPEGQMYEALARQAATSPDGVFNEQAYSDQLDQSYGEYLIRQADYSRLAEEAKAGADTAAISSRFWEVATPEAETLVQGAMGDLFNIVEQMRLNPGGRLELDPAVAQQMGLPTSTITAENLPLVLQTFRQTLRQQVRDTLQSQASFDVNPPSEEWYNQVLAPFDALTQAASDFDNLPSISSAIQSQGTINAYRRLREFDPNLANVIDFYNVVSPSLMTGLQQYLTGVGEDIQQYTNVLAASNPSPEQAANAVDSMSREDVEGMVQTAAAALGSDLPLNPDQVAGYFSMLVAGEARTVGDDGYYSEEAWQSIIGANTQQYLQAAQVNPNFAGVLENSLLSDINKTLTQIINESTDYGAATLVMNPDGTLDVGVNGMQIEEWLNTESATLMRDTDPTGYQDMINGLNRNVESFRNNPLIDLYNMKVSTLSSLGQVGSNITETLTLQNQSMIPLEGAAGDVEPAGGPEGDTLSSSSNVEDQFVPRAVPLPEAVQKDQEFIDQVQLVSGRLGIDPNHLLGIMAFETGGSFSPSQRNAAGSGATGLIQFMPSTAESLGTTTEALAGMSRAEQMQYVEKYFEPFAGRLNNFGDMYMAVLWPAAVGQSDDYVLFDGGTAYEQNAGLDIDGDGVVTRGEAVAKAAQRAGITNFQAPVGPVGTFAPQPDVQPYRRPAEATVDSGVLRPRARSSTPASEAPMRPQSRPSATSSSEATRRTTASSQANKASRDKAIEVLLRNGFSRSELSVMGIT